MHGLKSVIYVTHKFRFLAILCMYMPTSPAHAHCKTNFCIHKARTSVLKRLTKIVGKDGLYHSVMLVLVDDVGTVQTYSNSPGWRTYLSCEDNIRRLLSKRKPKLSHQQRLAKVSVYGEPPTPQHAFDVLNTNACENLLRVMEFSKLKGQDIPMHMQALQGAYIHLGKYLDEDGRGKVDGNKFEGHDKKNGRFKAQLFKEHELCKLDAWVSGECPKCPCMHVKVYRHIHRLLRKFI
jgi:hypothetical protein